MGFLLTIPLLIWGFFNPHVASIVFISIFVFLELVIAFTNRSGKIRSHKKLDSEEVELFNRYNFFFRYPMTSRGFSKTFSAIMLSVFVWVPLLIWKGEYIQAVVIGLNYFVGASLSAMTNPQLFLSNASRSGNRTAERELHIVNGIIEKFYGYNPEKDTGS